MKGIKILYIILSVLLGITFLFSAYSKTIPITDFVNNIYDRFPITYQFASYVAKGMVGLEAAIGFLLMLHIYGKWRWVLKISMAMLIAFTIFIISIWVMEGSQADCGCMGNLVKFSPFWSIVKNVVMMAIIAVLIWKDPQPNATKRNIFAWILTAVLITYPFVFTHSQMGIGKINDQIKTAGIDYQKGKHIVAFMSTTCSHCRDAAIIFEKFKEKDSTMPMVILLRDKTPNQEEFYQDFLEETGIKNIPIYFIPQEDFNEFSGRGVPSIYLVEDDAIVNKIDNFKKVKLKDLQKWYR